MIGIAITYLDYVSMYVESGGRIINPVVGTLVYQVGILGGQLGYAAALNMTQLVVTLVLVLVGAPWLVRQGATTGTIMGALTYVMQGMLPALQTLVRGLGNTGLWLLVTLRRIVEAGRLIPVSVCVAVTSTPGNTARL